jgi:hypothetical protein
MAMAETMGDEDPATCCHLDDDVNGMRLQRKQTQSQEDDLRSSGRDDTVSRWSESHSERRGLHVLHTDSAVRTTFHRANVISRRTASPSPGPKPGTQNKRPTAYLGGIEIHSIR